MLLAETPKAKTGTEMENEENGDGDEDADVNGDEDDDTGIGGGSTTPQTDAQACAEGDLDLEDVGVVRMIEEANQNYLCIAPLCFNSRGLSLACETAVAGTRAARRRGVAGTGRGRAAGARDGRRHQRQPRLHTRPKSGTQMRRRPSPGLRVPGLVPVSGRGKRGLC